MWLYKRADSNDVAGLLRGLRAGKCEGRRLTYLERCLCYHALRTQRMRLLRSVCWGFVAAKGGAAPEGGGQASVSLHQAAEWMGLDKDNVPKERVRYLAEYHGVRLVRRGKGFVLWPEGKKSAQSFLPAGDGTPFVAARSLSLVRPPPGVQRQDYGRAPLAPRQRGSLAEGDVRQTGPQGADPNARAQVVLATTWAVRNIYRMPSYGTDSSGKSIVVSGSQRAKIMESKGGGGLAKGGQVWCGGMPEGYLWVEPDSDEGSTEIESQQWTADRSDYLEASQVQENERAWELEPDSAITTEVEPNPSAAAIAAAAAAALEAARRPDRAAPPTRAAEEVAPATSNGSLGFPSPSL